MAADTKNDEPKIATTTLTSEDASAIISTESGTVEVFEGVQPLSEEVADGVTSVEAANVTPGVISNRPELVSQLSPGFKGVMVRLQHRPTGDTTQLITETYFGNPIVDGKPVEHGDESYKSQSERHQEVFVLGSDGALIRGYRQTVNEDWTKPASEVSRTTIGEPIEDEGLAERVATLVADLRTCADAGR